jgi:hypothetical protein
MMNNASGFCEQKRKSKLSQVICDLSKVGKMDFHKNGKNVYLRQKLPTILGQKWMEDSAIRRLSK